MSLQVEGAKEGVPTDSLAAVKDAMLGKLYGRPPSAAHGRYECNEPMRSLPVHCMSPISI